METSMMATESLTVIKRNGQPEDLNLEKIHIMVEEACQGL